MRGSRSANTASATGAPGITTALISVKKVPFTCEDHGDIELVGLGDVLLVAHRSTGLDDHRDTGFGRRLDAVGEGIERVTRARAALGASGRLLRRDLSRLDTVLLSGTDAPRHAVAHQDDGVRLHVAADPERELGVVELGLG